MASEAMSPTRTAAACLVRTVVMCEKCPFLAGFIVQNVWGKYNCTRHGMEHLTLMSLFVFLEYDKNVIYEVP